MNARGVTFLELLIVVGIFSVMAAMAYPSIVNQMDTPGANAKKFISIVRYVNDSSINRRQEFEITIDLKAKTVSWTDPEGKKTTAMKTLKEVFITSKGLTREGRLKITFGKSGLEEILRVYFQSGNTALVAAYNPYSKKVSIEPLK
ncbi:MAG: prepilin-type N-terminal cleavage/methylation domain-containing protein [Nitrospirae bacterium]|nr:prepilin-type N-terminal cleavage/methylation domain-containing protein [Nitrospirota bacterium]